jgi:glycine cleavage system regulatory protein
VSNGQAMRGAVQNGQQERQKSETPELHINLQIHISSDSSADQIDQIFASMSKHIYRRDIKNE